MTTTMIIEAADTPAGDTIATVQTARGREYSVNMDRLALALADVLCDMRNDEKNGWIVKKNGYAAYLRRLEVCAESAWEPS